MNPISSIGNDKANTFSMGLRPRQAKKKRESQSDDEATKSITLKRVKENLNDCITYEKKSPSTKYFRSPFLDEECFSFSIQLFGQFNLKQSKYPLLMMREDSFINEHENLVNLMKVIMGKKEKDKKVKIEMKMLKAKKYEEVQRYFEDEVKDFKAISEYVGLSRQIVRLLSIRYEKFGTTQAHKGGPKKKLNGFHLCFIRGFLLKNENYDKTIENLRGALISHFNKSDKFISMQQLHRIVKELEFTYKRIQYKVSMANTLSTRKKRKEVALSMLPLYLGQHQIIYIDESSFNIQIRQDYGWAPIGCVRKCSKPAKSVNYSLIASLTINGFLGLKIVKGGVKSGDFLGYLHDLITHEKDMLKNNKVIFIMGENTPFFSIHEEVCSIL